MTPTFPFSVIDAHGQVKFSGNTQHTEDLAPGGCSVLLESPVDNCWYDGSAWIPMGTQPSTEHVYDWPSHSWVDPRTLQDLKTSLLAEAATKRWSLVHATDIVGLRRALQDLESSGLPDTMFKLQGGWRSMTVEQLRTEVKRVADYVQLCFTAEHTHATRINALTSLQDALTYSLADQPTGPT